MSNRTDFHALSGELATMFYLNEAARERIETELHNAYVAGEEGNGCECRWCKPKAAPVDDCTREAFIDGRSAYPCECRACVREVLDRRARDGYQPR